MFTEKDFTFDRIERPEGHEDYWFKTSEKADNELLRHYGEQGCEHIFEVLYSKDEDIVGIKRQFLFNWDVVMSTDDNLKNILRKLAN